jgi:hypothetical protein
MTSIPGFPNFFTILGPNSPVGSIHLQTAAELTCDHIINWVQKFSRREIATVDVTREATERFNADVRTALEPTVWNTGCQSWYFKKDGSVDLWPFDLRTLKGFLETPDLADYRVTRPAPALLTQSD